MTQTNQAAEITPVGDLYRLEPVRLSRAARWERNPKLHDITGLIDSLLKYGFQDPPKFDAALNEGQGGLVFGNGRIEALQIMKAQGSAPPRGIASDEATGEWLVPVLFGNDQPGRAAAEAFAVDHNNLTMTGGDYTSVFTSQMWDEVRYVEMLNDIPAADLPVSVSAEDLAVMNAVIIEETPYTSRADKGAKIRLGMYRFYLPRPQYEAWEAELVARVGEDKEAVVAELRQRLGLNCIMNEVELAADLAMEVEGDSED